MEIRRVRAVNTALLVLVVTASIAAEDWPEIRGKGRLGVWNETGILEKFPETGLKVLWRTPLKNGFSGPSVANGRVFVMDFNETQRLRGTERALALDEKTGKILWTQEWPVEYRGMSYANGPRATPTVDGDRVYFAGADGKLFCLNAEDRRVVWKKDYVADYGADRAKWGFDWGFSSAPLVDGNRLIALVGGQPDAKVVAFDKMTGKEIWRALSSETELGVAQPIIITAGGTRQLIIWYPGAVTSLDPVTGKTYWEQPYKVGASMTVPTPVQSGNHAVPHEFLRWPADAGARSAEARRHGDVEREERQRDSDSPKMIPVKVNLHTSRDRTETSSYEIATDSFLTPLLLNITLFNTITSSERALGDSTISVKGEIKVKGQEPIQIDRRFSAANNAAIMASGSIAAPVSSLLTSGFDDVQLDGITLDISSTETKYAGTLERITLDRTEVRRGEKVEVQAYVRTESGKQFVQRIPVQIPEDAALGQLLVFVGDGGALQEGSPAKSFVPQDLSQLVKAINTVKKSDRLYVKLFRITTGAVIGTSELPSLPPSMVATLNSDRTSGGYTPTVLSPVYEMELPPAEFVISGQQLIAIDVVR